MEQGRSVAEKTIIRATMIDYKIKKNSFLVERGKADHAVRPFCQEWVMTSVLTSTVDPREVNFRAGKDFDCQTSSPYDKDLSQPNQWGLSNEHPPRVRWCHDR